MKSRRLIVLIIISIVSSNYVISQNKDTYDLFLRFAKLYNSGDLLNAEKCMHLVLESKESLYDEYRVAAYNNLGATCTLLGNYAEALNYYDLAEIHITGQEQNALSLANIYINEAIIYGFQRSFTSAIEYFEKGIRMCQKIDKPDQKVIHSISTAFLNIGIIYYKIKDYDNALEYLEKSAALKKKFNLPKIALTYFNIAKTYAKIDNPKKAEEFFLKSIKSFNIEFGEDYFRKADLFFDYGLFLQSEGRNSEALRIFNRALSICIKTYGDKSIFVSIAYKHLGDYFLNRKNCDSALVFYQKALIALVNNFNDMDIYSNPPVKSSIYDINFLDILKSKSQAFKLLAMRQANNEIRVEILKKSLGNLEMALKLINKIRNDYMNNDSRIYLADNEKETYIFATDIAHHLYEITGDTTFMQTMYNISRQSKVAVLRNEITDNELYYSINIPDSVQKKHKSILLDIGAYSNLIQEERRKVNPDKKKIEFWEDNVFEMKRANEKVEDKINKLYPQYRDLLHKTKPISLKEIQNNLKKDETLVEYFLSNQYKDNRRKLYIFVVTTDKLNFLETDLDTIFKKDVETIRQGTVSVKSTDNPLKNFKDYTAALFNMYSNLIKPVENLFIGDKLIIVPDEELAFLPFEAFLNSSPDSTQINYEELQYLIYHYTFSYGYSSSLIFNEKKNLINQDKVYAFSPDYLTNADNSAKSFEYLAGAAKEIGSILSWFPGAEYLGEKATEANFKAVILHPGIIHLAMHSFTDPDNSKYSCLMFDSSKDTLEDGKLYNYEISLSRINSPMVVLSSCNTGSGTLSRGEGIISLARGFILAGALSVVITTWDINDEASATIITRFYYHLSKGEKKAEAMRLAKLEYLKNQPSVYTNPYYWAGFEMVGDNSPLVSQNRASVWSVSVILVLFTGVLMIYLKWRNILSARSR